MFNKIQMFFQDVILELKKVSWTTRKELIDSTIVVLVSLLILSVVIGVADYFLAIFVEKIIR